MINSLPSSKKRRGKRHSFGSHLFHLAQTLTHETSGGSFAASSWPWVLLGPLWDWGHKDGEREKQALRRWELLMWEVREQRQGKSKHGLDCVLRSPGWTDPVLGVLCLHSLQWAVIPQLKKVKNQFWVSSLNAP